MNSGQFQKGRSGNPGGRPAVISEVQELARQHVPAAINRLVAIMNDPKASASAQVAAASAIIDRGYGKPLQSIEAMTSFRPASALSDEELAAIVMGHGETSPARRSTTSTASPVNAWPGPSAPDAQPTGGST